MADLFPCPGCRRHVAGDAACPFCGAAQPLRALRAPFAGAFTRAAIFGAALAAPACWTGDSPATTSTAPAVSPGTIEGLLTSSDTGEPLANQRITLRADKQPDRHATTDGAGRYRFTKVPPGNYVVVFLPPRPRGPSNMTTVQLAPGETQRVNWAAVFRDPSNIPMPYGAPPARRRIV